MSETPYLEIAECFPTLDSVQLLELSAKVLGPLGGEVRTEVNAQSSATFVRGADGALKLVVFAKIGLFGSKDEKNIFETSVRLAGAWNARGDWTLGEGNELLRIAGQIKMPILYPLARLNIMDVLARMGIHPNKLPWNPQGIQQEGVSDTGVETKKKKTVRLKK